MDLQQLIGTQTHVALTLATHLLSNESPDSNVVFSPLTIHVVLSLVAAGAKGHTLDQILGFLKTNTTDELNSLYSQLVPLIFADDSPNGGPQLLFANGVWVEKTCSFKPSFKHVVDVVYKAACSQVDFRNKALEVVKQVNLWAEKETSGLIKQVIPIDAVDSLTRLIFANAVYFKGTWSERFYPWMTKESDFHLLDGSKVQVPFMTSNKNQFVQEYDDFKVLGLPYLQGDDKRKFTMYILLPDVKDSLQSLLGKILFTPDFLDQHIPRRKVNVGQFSIPKFKFSFEFEASNMLKSLGLVLPFCDVDDLTEMVHSPTNERLYVSGIYHKSFVNVNEQGTEAAAVSAVIIEAQCGMRITNDKVDFVADHPFLFVIMEDVTKTVLFMGHMVDPRID